ncbi:DUF2868 domain-containing protein [Poriferisphaera corsica]|uniref:DUF2868 domain-containing protein n=1 Tax=Poriferisphaera corsica TaxID=2528020 RepID=UPI001F3D82FD|nr:DUF2868 domain-containing protein [Poriferisphaera corsica]
MKLKRDMRIAPRLNNRQHIDRIQLWLSNAMTQSSHTNKLIALSSILLIILGLIIGILISKSAYYYNGSTPINVMIPIAIFVFVQLGLSFLTVIAMLPSAFTRKLPLATSLQDSILAINPGNLILIFKKILPSHLTENILNQFMSTKLIYANLQKWTILRFAQSFSLAINIAAITTFVVTVIFSDLAFSWSTTLNLNQQTIQTVTQILALPFAFLPDLTPNNHLIQTTQYFRGNPSDFDPILARNWWPFLLACMITYGFLPRLVLYIIAAQIQRRTIKSTILNLPDTTLLLTRLDHLQQSPQNSYAKSANISSSNDSPINKDYLPQNYNLLIIDHAPIPSEFHLTPHRKAHFGGTQSIEEDSHAIKLFTSNLAPENHLLILSKLWEPPTLETLNLLQTVRDYCSPTTPIHLLLTPKDDNGNIVTSHNNHMTHWKNKINSLHDPHIFFHNTNLMEDNAQ